MHYPHGNITEYSTGILKTISEDNYNICHSCQSQPGSSGSSIINLINHKVLGVHKGAPTNNRNYNLGTFLKEPIKDFNAKMKNIYNKNIFLSDNLINIEINKNKKLSLLIEDIKEEEHNQKYEKDENNLKKILS